MQLSYLRLAPDARGSGSVVSFGFRGQLPGGGNPTDDRDTLLAAVRSAVEPFADRRRELVQQQTAATTASRRAAEAADRLEREIAAAQHTMHGAALTAQLADLRRRHARADASYHDFRVQAGDAADAITAVDEEARSAAASAAATAAERLAGERRRAADDLAKVIWSEVVDDVATYFALRDAVDDLTDARTSSAAAAAALREAGFPPAPRAGIMAGPSRAFSTLRG